MSNIPWIEKYRPKSFKEIISHDEIINTLQKLISCKKFPHTVFFGPPGTGKTSTIISCAKEIYGEKYKTMVLNGSLKTNMSALEYAKYLEEIGVGEILLQNIDLDGIMEGFDINLIDLIYKNIDIPLTVLGGAGSLEDIRKLIKKFKLIGVAAGSLFVFKGKHRAVLVNYPDSNQKKKVLLM